MSPTRVGANLNNPRIAFIAGELSASANPNIATSVPPIARLFAMSVGRGDEITVSKHIQPMMIPVIIRAVNRSASRMWSGALAVEASKTAHHARVGNETSEGTTGCLRALRRLTDQIVAARRIKTSTVV